MEPEMIKYNTKANLELDC